MWTKPYGSTGHDVSVIGFGGMRFAKPEEIDPNAEVVLHGYRKGINYFDTAPGYCNDKSEDIMGAAIRQMPRDDIFVSTKTFKSKPDEIRTECERSLKRLNTDYLDFYHMWCLARDGEYQARCAEGAIDGFMKLKEEGLVRHVVCSSHLQGDALREVLKTAPFEGVTLGYCAINFPYRDSAVDTAREMGLGVVTMNPLGGGVIPRDAERFGFLKGPDDASVVQGALRFNVSNPGITTALVGFTTTGHVDEAVAAVEGFTPYPADRIETIRENILGGFDDLCTGCGYCLPCPDDVRIPELMDAYNMKVLGGDDGGVLGRLNWHWQVDPESTKTCSQCGACEDKCTQHLKIIERLAAIAEMHDAAQAAKESK